MRFKSTVFLTIILIILGFYLYFVEFPEDEKKREIVLKEGKLYSFMPNDITRVVIRRPEGEIDLEHFPGHPETPWKIFQPVVTVANPQIGEDLAARLAGMKASRLVEAKPRELVDFGLDPPAYTVIVTLQRNDTEIVEVGDENLTGSDVYVRKGEGTSLYLVPAGIKELLSKDLMAWRQKEVFPYSSFDIGMMRLVSPRGILDLSKDENGWSMRTERIENGETISNDLRGDGSEIANLLGSIVNLQGQAFIDRGKEAKIRRFAPPLLKIRIQVGKVEREGVFYQDDEDPNMIDVVTLPTDPIFQIPAVDLKVLDQAFETYRDRRVVSLTFPEEIESLEIVRPNEHFHLSKQDGQWVINGKETLPIEASGAVSRLLTDLFNLRVASFLDGVDSASPETGLDRPALRLHLKGKNSLPLGEISLGSVKDATVYSKSTGQPFLFALNKDILDRIPLKTDLLPK